MKTIHANQWSSEQQLGRQGTLASMQVRHVANSANGRLTGQEAGQEARKTEQRQSNHKSGIAINCSSGYIPGNGATQKEESTHLSAAKNKQYSRQCCRLTFWVSLLHGRGTGKEAFNAPSSVS